MSLKFKGNKSVEEVLQKSKLIKKEKKQEQIKFPHEEISDFQLEIQNAKMATKTPAQLKYDLIRQKRLPGRVQERINITHKQRIEKFNKSLSNLSEHYDIPKIGPG